MELETWQVHIRNRTGCVEPRENIAQLNDVSANTPRGSSFVRIAWKLANAHAYTSLRRSRPASYNFHNPL